MEAVAPSALIRLLLKSTSGVTFTRWTAVPVWPAPSVALHVTVLAPGRKWVGLAVTLWPFTCVTVAVMPSSAVAVPMSTGVKRPIASTVISAGAVTSGPLTGVTLLEGVDAALSPAELVATAGNIYAVPSVKPVGQRAGRSDGRHAPGSGGNGIAGDGGATGEHWRGKTYSRLSFACCGTEARGRTRFYRIDDERPAHLRR